MRSYALILLVLGGMLTPVQAQFNGSCDLPQHVHTAPDEICDRVAEVIQVQGLIDQLAQDPCNTYPVLQCPNPGVPDVCDVPGSALLPGCGGSLPSIDPCNPHPVIQGAINPCGPVDPCILQALSILPACGGNIDIPNPPQLPDVPNPFGPIQPPTGPTIGPPPTVPPVGGLPPVNPCAGVTLPPCGPVPPLACGTVAQCVTSLLPNCNPATPGSLCSVACILPGVPVVNPTNPATPAPGGTNINTVTLTANPCTGVTQTPGTPVFIPVSLQCPETRTFVVPDNPRLQDRDGDDIPAYYYDNVHYELDANCRLTKTYTGTGVLPFPDPDDNDHNTVCGPATGATFTAPEGALVQDRDGDGWQAIYVQMAEFELTSTCGLVKRDQYEVLVDAPDPDDQDPNVPPTDALGLCGAQQTTCVVFQQPVLVPCGVEDQDKDRVPAAYVCGAQLKVYSNGAVRVEEAGIQTSLGDPNDHDPCVPISDTFLNPQCRPGGRKYPDGGGNGNFFAAENDGRVWWGVWIEHTSWLWLLIIIGLLLLYIAGREKQKKDERKHRRARR